MNLEEGDCAEDKYVVIKYDDEVVYNGFSDG